MVTNDIILEKATQYLGQDFISAETPFDLLTITVAKNRIIDILQYLKTDASLNFIFLTDITAVHYPNQLGSELCVVYHLHNLEQNIRVRIKIMLKKILLAKCTIIQKKTIWTYVFVIM